MSHLKEFMSLLTLHFPKHWLNRLPTVSVVRKINSGHNT